MIHPPLTQARFSPCYTKRKYVNIQLLWPLAGDWHARTVWAGVFKLAQRVDLIMAGMC